MRDLILCDGNMEPSVINEMIKNGTAASADRTIILTEREGPAWEKGSIINVPVGWGLEETDFIYRTLSRKLGPRVNCAISSTDGLHITSVCGGVERLLAQIDMCDPDVIDLRKLGGGGQSLKSRCLHRFPERKVLAGSDYYERDENLRSWRTYDPTALVSIILPTYNGERYLGVAIESCLNQTHDNFELIIVDDDSSANTPDIISRYAARDSRIRHLARTTPRPSLPEILNKGLNAAKGKFLTWFQSDSVYRPNAIEYMVQQLCTFDKIRVAYFSSHRIDEEGEPISSCFDPTFSSGGLSRWTVLSAPFLYRRELGEIEDFDFLMRACILLPTKFYSEPCYFYRHHTTCAQQEPVHNVLGC